MWNIFLQNIAEASIVSDSENDKVNLWNINPSGLLNTTVRDLTPDFKNS